MSNSVRNIKVEWSATEAEFSIHDVNCEMLEQALNYQSANKQVGHTQEASIAVSFNNEAALHGSSFRVKVNPKTNDTGGRDLLLIDIRTGEEVGAFESKRYSSKSAKSNFKKHTDPNSAKYYMPGTQVLVNAEQLEKLQAAFPDYDFDSSLVVPDVEGGNARSIQLAADRSEVLFQKMISLAPGERFTMQGPQGKSAAGRNIISVVVERDYSGRYSVRYVSK